LSAAGLVVALLGACGPRFDAKLAHLRSLQESGHYDDTLQPLREILSKSPDNPDANFLLGLSLMQTGHTPDAVGPLRKAAASDAYATEGGILLASAFMASQSYGEAVTATSRVIQKEPSLYSAWAVQAQAHLASGDFAGALADADKLVELQPEQIAGHLIRASALQRLERLDDVDETFALVLEKAKAKGETALAARVCVERAKLARQRGADDPHTEQAMLACVAEYPADPGVLGAASDFYASSGRTAEGEKLWRDAAARSPDSIPLRLGFAHDLARHGLVDDAEATLVSLTQSFPASIEAWKALAELQRARGAFDRALSSLDSALKSSAGDEALRLARGDLLVIRGDLDGAEAALTTLPDGVSHDLLQGRLYFARRQYTKSLDVLGSALNLAPQNAGARVLAAQAAEHVGDRQRAIDEYRTALRLEPSIVEARLALARLLLTAGGSGEAADLVWPLTAESSPKRAEALRLLAVARAQAGDTVGAREAATTLRGLPGGAPAAWEVLADLERKSGGLGAVVRLLEHAKLDYMDPANANVLRVLTGALLDTGHGDEAQAVAGRALAAHPDVPAFLDLQGVVQARLGKLDAARLSFEKAQKIDPSDAAALVGLARLEGVAGNADQAIALLDRAAALDPLNGSTAYLTAQLALSVGHKDDAEQRLRILVLRNPEIAAAANDLAYLLADRGAELDFALRLAERGVAAAPTTETLDTLGYVHLRRGESEQAAVAFRRALALRPDAGVTLFHLGLALNAQGDREGARVAFQQALRQGPFPERAMAQSELTKLATTPQEASR